MKSINENSALIIEKAKKPIMKRRVLEKDIKRFVKNIDLVFLYII